MATSSVKDLYDAFEKDELIVLPSGSHRLLVDSCSVKNENGVLPTFRVVGGDNDGKRVLAGQQTLTENSAGIFFRNMKGFGLDRNYFEPLLNGSTEDLVKQVANDLPGRVVDVQIQIDTWNNEERNKIAIGGIKLVGMKDAAGQIQYVEGASPAAPQPQQAPQPQAPQAPQPQQPPQPQAPQPDTDNNQQAPNNSGDVPF